MENKKVLINVRVSCVKEVSLPVERMMLRPDQIHQIRSSSLQIHIFINSINKNTEIINVNNISVKVGFSGISEVKDENQSHTPHLFIPHQVCRRTGPLKHKDS